MRAPIRQLRLPVLFALVVGVATAAAAQRVVTLDHGARSPAVSPDSRTIAFSLVGRIATLPIRGGETTIIANDAGWNSWPAFSPDGVFLAYVHMTASGSDLMLFNRATGETALLYHSEPELRQIAFSPTGETIYFIAAKNQLEAHLWQMPLATLDPKQLTFAKGWHEWWFAVAPDEQHVIVDSGRYGAANLYRVSIDGKQLTRLTKSAATNDSNVQWSHDGATLVSIETENGVESVVTRAASGGAPRKVLSGPYEERDIGLLPDGKSAVLSEAGKLYRLDLATGKTEPIPFSARITMPSQTAADLVITHARLFDGVHDAAQADMTIEVKGGRIAAIHRSAASSSTNAGTQAVDAAGKFVMSGLMDNHYHYWFAQDGAGLLAHGITTIRDPGVDIANGISLKEANALDLAPGPTIYSCGPLVDGAGGYHPLVDVEITTPDAAEPLVHSLRAQGADCIKVYFMLEPAVLAAVVEAAHKEGMPVTGHIGVHTSWQQAMDEGIDGLNHVRIWHDLLPMSRQPQGEDESLDGQVHEIARMQADWSDIDPDGPQAGKIIAAMQKHKIGFDPTLTVQQLGERARGELSLDEFHTGVAAYNKMGRFVRRANREGVMLLAGTDDGSLNDEMEAYASFGISNLDILRAATINGARWLNQQDEFGTVEVGKRADLIVVNGDPLKDVKDLRKITRVIQRGRIVR
ncbi:MAG TPA: amidohydrolase family protein [Acidobacteriaceae bacterium]|nr:amidohydrolase family protein [Acidobacteriaceae bacterium]